MKAVIELYNAYCKCEGFKTGWVGYTSAAGDPPLTKSDVRVAEKIVREALGTGTINIRNTGGTVYRSFLTNEDQVQPFVDIVHSEFPNAAEVVDIGGSSNGKIAFRRKVFIPGVFDTNEVIDRLSPKFNPISDEELIQNGWNPKEVSGIANRNAWNDVVKIEE